MSLIEKLTDHLIERRMRRDRIDVSDPCLKPSEIAFRRVLNTLRENNVMVSTREDGIYIRMAGTESDGEAFSLEWAKVLAIERKPPEGLKVPVSDCCFSPNMIEPDYDEAEEMGSLWRAYACYICRECGNACSVIRPEEETKYN